MAMSIPIQMGATMQDYTLHTLGVISANVLLITTEKMQRVPKLL